MSSSATVFRGLWIPLVTPFREGMVDHEALASLVRRLAPAGIAGFVVCGSTGEAAALADTEQLACLETVARHAGNLPLIMGLSGYNLRDTTAWVQQLAAVAAASTPRLRALLVPAPHYVRPSQAGIRHWFETLADASARPLILYDIPYRTGATMTRETMLALADHPNIQAVKDCGGDGAKTQALIADGRLAVLAGEDLQVFSSLACGGAGAITASAHLHTRRFVRTVEALLAGDLAGARAAWQPLLPLIEALFAEPNPGPLKALLARRGWAGAELRAPMTGVSAALLDRLGELDARLDEAPSCPVD